MSCLEDLNNFYDFYAFYDFNELTNNYWLLYSGLTHFP
jgi:hypothetical protein